MNRADILVIGGGVAGLSAAAALARHGRVVVLEAEEAVGVHSSGRSATFSHYGIGNHAVRALTAWSRPFFAKGVAERAAALFVASVEMLPELDALEAEMARFTGGLRRVGEAEMADLFPPLRVGREGAVAGCVDPDGLRLDSDAMLQGYARAVRAAGGEVLTGRRVARIAPAWIAVTESGEEWTAPVLVNAAGAWADAVAKLAGVRPLALRPLRRTIVIIDAPAGADVRSWPFVKTAVDDFYILPEGGRLAASPVDEIESGPCDAQPEDYDVALAAWKIERYTSLSVARILHRRAGLRTFTVDRVPAAGFAADAPGFFWLAGQGGYGLQTAPAMAAITESLIAGGPWPDGLAELGAGPAEVGIGRLAPPAPGRQPLS
ncbi:MAG: D-arginine dehydrogenase [Sphingomonadales bacterium]|jgi:D-arginine dehydrogenase|nr:D-arginine dehydrogenase [Sphingomonadales bacterium]